MCMFNQAWVERGSGRTFLGRSGTCLKLWGRGLEYGLEKNFSSGAAANGSGSMPASTEQAQAYSSK